MIEEWLNVLLFLSGCIKPSAISGVYMLTALFILVMLLTIYQVPKFVYKCLFFISLLLVTWKSIMLTLLYEGYISEVFEKERELLHLLGIFYTKDLTWDESSSFTFIPDTLAFVCSIIGWIYAKKVRFKPSDSKRKNFWLFCSFLALTGTCASNFSYMNISYFLLWVYWSCSWALRLSKSTFKCGVLLISLMTTMQMVFSFFYFILLNSLITEDEAELYGIILNKPRFLPNYILVFVLHCFSTMYVRKAGIKEENAALNEKLIHNQDFLPADKASLNPKPDDIEESRRILMLKVQETNFDDESESSGTSESLKTDSDASGYVWRSGSSSQSSDSEEKRSAFKKEKKNQISNEKKLEEQKDSQETAEKLKEEQKDEQFDETSQKNIKDLSDKPTRDLPEDDDEAFINEILKGEGNVGLTSVVSMLKCSYLLKLLLSPTLLFFLARFLLFFWIFYFKSAMGVYIMLWLFYSIIELNYDRMIIMSRFTLIPVLVLDSFLTYLFKTISLDLPQITGFYYKYFPALELLFQFFTIITFIFINRVLGYNTKVSIIENESKTIWGIFYTILQQNSDKISLIVLFLVGLSDINLFHFGFIVICLVFLFNIQLARKYWKVLMFYTMAVLLIRYIWVLVSQFYELSSGEVLKLIGLPSNSSTKQELWQVIPYDYTIWILLLSSSIQNRAFGSTMFSLDYYKLTKKEFRKKHPLMVKYIVNVYEWYTIFQVWVSYFFIFLIMLLSPLNILNYLRFTCFCIFMVIHLKDVMVEISSNYLKVKKIWGITVYYSGAILIVRYIYQFIPFLPFPFNSQFTLIGLEVYESSELYRNMVSDCMLLLFCILESRNRAHNLERESFDFEEVGFISGVIRSNLSLIGQEKHVIAALQFLEEPFPLIVLFSVSTIAIYWKLSLSMICYLVAIGWYLLRLGNYFGEVVEHKQLYSPEIEWEKRVSVWNVLFLLTFANFLLAYAEFLVSPKVFGEKLYQKVLWIYFCCGYSKSEGRSLLDISYGYVILWVLLIIERHCIEFMLNTRVNISQEDEFRRLKNKNLTLMKTLDFLRIFVEALVPMFVLIIAFNKLTFVSIIYVLSVFMCIILASPYRRTHYLNTIVICMIWLQYLLILSNIQTKNSPEHPPKDKQVTNTPWYTRIDWKTSDDPVFLNLGTSFSQLENTYSDLLCSLFIMIYYKFLCTKEHELFLLELSNTGLETPSKSKTVFLLVKKTIYNISHLIIFLFVLLFIIQNNGIISGVYCAFCLIFIYGANQNIRSERRWNQYLRILRIYFLNFMLLDLTLNILIQIPFGLVTISNDGWLVAIGVERLWRAGQDSPPVNQSALHKKVVFKIVAFAFLYMMYRMMRSQDFNKHMDSERIHLKTQGKIYGLSLAREFNNKRIQENSEYVEKRARFETELKKLDVNVQKWNQKFYEEKRDSLQPSRGRAITTANRKTIGPQEEVKNEPSFRSKLQNLLIHFINPVIFRSYLETLNSKKKVVEAKEAEALDADSQGFEEVEFVEKKTLAEYNLTWKNYMMMIVLILMSNTQGLVYLFCLINHLAYASLESVVFPLTVIGYAMLEYPRPPFKYFRFVMLYSELVFFVKFTLQFQIWEFVFGSEFMMNYRDQYKTGFNRAHNTYSGNLVNYVIWDVVVMLFVLLHEYSLLRVGLWKKTEYEMESLEEAKIRLDGQSVTGPRSSYNTTNRNTGCLSRASRQIKLFFNRLLPHNKEEKPGKDLYTPTLLVQLVILVYLFLFFSQMDGRGLNISESFKANQFQGRMVIAIMFHIGIMIIERYLYLARTSQALKLAVARLSRTQTSEPNIKWDRPLQLKLALHLILLLNMLYIVFWYFPINSTEFATGDPYCRDLYDETKCNNFQLNSYLKVFYLIYVVYLMIVSLQLKYGLPSFRSGSFPLMKSTSRASKLMFQFYRGIPFLFEIRTLVDWVFTLTTLDLFQWLKFENLYAQLYINQCNSKGYLARVRGTPIGTGSKLSMGCCSLVVIFAIILAPLILFSSLNPVVEFNKVKSISVQIGIIIDDNYFNFYSASRVSDIHSITDSEWETNKFNSLDGIDSNDKEVMQVISMPTTSDSLWDITPHSYNQLCNSFEKNLKENTSDATFHMSHTYTRRYPVNVPKVSQEFSYKLTYSQTSSLNHTVCSNISVLFNYPNLPVIVVWLPSSGENMSPDVINDYDSKKNIVLKKLEDPFGYYYWEVGTLSAEDLQGLQFFTISEKYSPMTFSFSVVTFYISVVGLAGRLLRWVLAGPVNFIMTEMPNPEPLINMCNGVYLSRMTGDLLREEELYYELVDIIRSPEMLKSITGRSSIKEKTE